MASNALTFNLYGKDVTASKTMRDVAGTADDVGKRLGNMAKVAAGALAAAFSIGAVVNWGKETVNALGRIEQINAQTAAALRSTGAEAWVTADHVEQLAGELENLTATEAESIQKGANLLLTFKNIQNSAGEGNDIFDQSVRVMTDMARAMGTDAESGAIQLGKALNDPIGGIAALTRVGVQFTDEQKNMIASMVEAGDVMGAQKVILAELNSQFGGSGAAYAETYAGKVELLKHAFGTFSESLLSGVIPALTSFATAGANALNWLAETPAVTGFGSAIVDTFSEAAEFLRPFVKEMSDILGPVIAQLAPQVLELASSFSPFGLTLQALAPLLPTIASLLAEVGTILSGTLSQVMPIITSVSEQFAGVIGELIGALLPPLAEILMALLPVLTPLIDAFLALLAPILELLSPLIELVAMIITPLIELLVPLISLLADGLTLAFEGLTPIIQGVAEFLRDLLMPIIEGATANFKGMIDFITNVFQGNWEGAWQAIAGIFENTWNSILEVGRVVINGLIDLVNGAIRTINGGLSGIRDATGGVINFGLIPEIPHLAEGGIVTSATLALIGEGSEPEVVAPLSKLPEIAQQYNPQQPQDERPIEIHVHPQPGMSEEQTGRAAAEALTFALRSVA